MQGDMFAPELGGIMEVAMWLCTLLLVGLSSSLGLIPNYVVLALGNDGVGPHHMQGRHTHRPKVWFKEAALYIPISEVGKSVKVILNSFTL